MINEVTITATFVTGTSQQDSAKAEEGCKELLLRLLRIHDIATETGSPLFLVKILKVESEKI